MVKRILPVLFLFAAVFVLSSCMSMLGMKAYPIHRFTEEGALENGYESAAVVLVGSPLALSQFPGGTVDTDIITRGGQELRCGGTQTGKA